MKKGISVFKKLCLILCLFVASMAKADLYEISGIEVSSEQSNATQARDAALAEGELEEFNQLIVRLSGEDALSQIPSQNTESVVQFVRDVSIENEKLTATRYSGVITVRFNSKMVEEFLKTHEITYLSQEAPSLLVIPVYQDGGKQYILDERNPLYQGLKQKLDVGSFYRIALPMGDVDEIALTEKALNQDGDLSLLAPLLSVYEKDKICILRMHPETQDGVILMDSSIWPEIDMASQMVFKRFRLSSGPMVPASVDMAKTIFETMAEHWRSGNMSRLDDSQVIYARVPVSSLQEWQSIEKEMSSWKFLDNAIVRGAYLPQMLVELSFSQNVEDIKRALAERGWVLTLDFTGSGASLVKGGNGE